MRWAWLVAVVACGNHSDAPPPAPRDAAARAADAKAQLDAPPAPPAKPTAVKLVVGERASCAVMSDATARCWGANPDGLLGDGTTTDSATPVTPALRGVRDLVFGAAHACALLDDGSVVCWGKIGFGKDARTPAPAGVPGVTKVKHVFAIGGASCASAADGTLACWGDVDARGHLGAGGAVVGHRPPTAVVGLDHVFALTAGGALRDDGEVVLWSGDHAGVTGVVELATRGAITCGRFASGEVSCFGADQPCGSKAKLAPNPSPKPKGKKGKKPPKVAKVAKPAPQAAQIVALKLPDSSRLAFDAGICVVTTSGKLECVDGCTTEPPWPGLAKVDVVAGRCARITDGSVRCWTADKRAAVAIAGVANTTLLDAAATRGCAIDREQRTLCWDGIGPAKLVAF